MGLSLKSLSIIFHGIVSFNNWLISLSTSAAAEADDEGFASSPTSPTSKPSFLSDFFSFFFFCFDGDWGGDGDEGLSPSCSSSFFSSSPSAADATTCVAFVFFAPPSIIPCSCSPSPSLSPSSFPSLFSVEERAEFAITIFFLFDSESDMEL